MPVVATLIRSASLKRCSACAQYEQIKAKISQVFRDGIMYEKAYVEKEVQRYRGRILNFISFTVIHCLYISNSNKASKKSRRSSSIQAVIPRGKESFFPLCICLAHTYSACQRWGLSLGEPFRVDCGA